MIRSRGSQLRICCQSLLVVFTLLAGVAQAQTAPTSHLYGKGISLAEYVTKSGGMTRKADEKRIYVVRANGAVVVNSGSAWTRRGTEMKPGDTIVVPMDTDHVPTLPLWQAVTQIIYNVAIAAAAVHSF